MPLDLTTLELIDAPDDAQPNPEFEILAAEQQWGITLPSHLITILHNSDKRLILNLTEMPEYEIIIKERTVTKRVKQTVTGTSVTGHTWSRDKYSDVLIGWLQNNRQQEPALRLIKSSRPKGARKTQTRFTDALDGYFSPSVHNWVQTSIYREQSFVVERTASLALKSGMNTYLGSKLHGQLTALFLFQRYETLMKKKLSDETRLVSLIYPSIHLLNDNQRASEYVPRLLRNTITDENYKSIIQRYVGKKNTRKDLLKAVNSNIAGSDWLLDAKMMTKAGLPIDWVIEFIKISDRKVHSRVKEFLPALIHKMQEEKVTPSQVRKLTLEMIQLANKSNWLDYWAFVCDTMRMLKEDTLELAARDGRTLPVADFRNLKKLHDSLAKRQYYKDLNMTPFPEQRYDEIMHNRTYTHEERTFLIIRPETELDLREWGAEAANCIGSYSSSVRNKRTNLYAVYDLTNKKKLHLTLEVNNAGTLYQAMEFANRKVDEEHWNVIAQMFKEAEKQLSPIEETQKMETVGYEFHLQGEF